jgi:hypothetical protein
VRGEHRDTGALTDNLQLGDGVGALQVGGDQQGGVPLLAQPTTELAREGGLTGALEAGEHDHRRCGLGEPQPSGLTPEDADEFLVDDLDDLLGRIQRLRDLGPDRPLPDGSGESADDGHRDVGVEQGTADLADRRIDVRFREPALAAQRLEGGGEAI